MHHYALLFCIEINLQKYIFFPNTLFFSFFYYLCKIIIGESYRPIVAVNSKNMRIINFVLALLFVAVSSLQVEAQRVLNPSGNNIGIIPTPQQVQYLPGSVATQSHIGSFCDQVVLICATNDGHSPVPSYVQKGQLYRISPTDKPSKKKLSKLLPAYYVCLLDKIDGATNQAEAYKIVIKQDSLIVYYVQPKGLHNAVGTLRALTERWDEVPCMIITDYPAYANRAWQDDISRGPVTNADCALFFTTFLGRYKLYTASPYTEHTLFNQFYNDLCHPQGNNSYTALPSYVDIIANLQCFGHFEKTLRVPFYWKMKDSPYNIDPTSHDALALVQSQIANTKLQFPRCHYFNINCDETEALGSGRARAWVDSLGANEAYCYHINNVYRMVKDSANEVLMWGDIVAKSPDMISKLPSDMNFICWNYSPSTDFSEPLRPFVEAKAHYGNPFWVAPSTCHYSSIQASTENYINNIAFFARDGYRYGASGILTTTWDDSGLDLLLDSPHALAWAAEMSWNPLRETQPDKAMAELQQREADFNANYNALNAHARFAVLDQSQIFDSNIVLSQTQQYLQRYANPYRHPLTDLIYAVSHLYSHPLVADWYRTAALQQPLLDFFPSLVDSTALFRADSVIELVSQICRRYDLPSLNEITYPQPKLILASMEFPATSLYALHRLQATAFKARLRCHLYQAYTHPSPELIRDCKAEIQFMVDILHSLKREYLALWDLENGSYSRDLVCLHFDNIAAELLTADRHVFIHSATVAGQTLVSLSSLFGHLPIYYTTDGRQPSQATLSYGGPFAIDRSCEVKAVSYNEWDEPSYTSQYTLCHKGIGALRELRSEYSTYRDAYSGGGRTALLDGQLGADNTYADGHWQGYWGNDIDAVLDLGKASSVNSITMRFFQHTFDWILVPNKIDVYTSKDGHSWTLARSQDFNPDFRHTTPHVETYSLQHLALTTRFLRVVVHNPGPLPDFHGAHGQPSYLFADEIVIE